MREISTETIKKETEKIFINANYILPDSVCTAINNAKKNETYDLAASVLDKLNQNIEAAKKINVPICQDTGMAVVFAEIGSEVCLKGELSFEEAINQGVRDAYINGYLRKSIVSDPLFNRKNTNDNTPAIIHTRIVKGDKIRLVAAPKGFGSENMSAVKMFTPSATEDDIIDFVVDVVKNAGSNPCPPIIVGVGIGGNFEYCTYLSKLALTRDLDKRNPDQKYAELEQKILDKINKLGIGPQGFGGKTTALAVNIEQYPTHIAGLPCAVNIGCHVTRHKEIVI